VRLFSALGAGWTVLFAGAAAGVGSVGCLAGAAGVMTASVSETGFAASTGDVTAGGAAATGVSAALCLMAK
jgi:hypothetical protein